MVVDVVVRTTSVVVGWLAVVVDDGVVVAVVVGASLVAGTFTLSGVLAAGPGSELADTRVGVEPVEQAAITTGRARTISIRRIDQVWTVCTKFLKGEISTLNNPGAGRNAVWGMPE